LGAGLKSVTASCFSPFPPLSLLPLIEDLSFFAALGLVEIGRGSSRKEASRVGYETLMVVVHQKVGRAALLISLHHSSKKSEKAVDDDKTKLIIQDLTPLFVPYLRIFLQKQTFSYDSS